MESKDSGNSEDHGRKRHDGEQKVSGVARSGEDRCISGLTHNAWVVLHSASGPTN
jgi:hypothetical protein